MKTTYTFFAVAILHLTRLEFGRMTPGMFYDMVQIWTNANKPAKSSKEFDD